MKPRKALSPTVGGGALEDVATMTVKSSDKAPASNKAGDAKRLLKFISNMQLGTIFSTSIHSYPYRK